MEIKITNMTTADIYMAFVYTSLYAPFTLQVVYPEVRSFTGSRHSLPEHLIFYGNFFHSPVIVVSVMVVSAVYGW